MDIRIGIINAPREVSLEMSDDTSIDDIKSTIDAAVTAGSGMVWLTDKKGRQAGFPAERIAYVELGSSEEPRIGFG